MKKLFGGLLALMLSTGGMTAMQIATQATAAHADGYDGGCSSPYLGDVVCYGGTDTLDTYATNGGAGPDSTQGCATVYSKQWINNLINQRLATFEVDQDWCWDNGIVTSAPPPKIKPSVSTLGGIVGWQYDGLDSSASASYYYDSPAVAGTNPKSGHRTIRLGQFHSCVVKIGCASTWYPENDIRVNSHGGYAVDYSH